MSEITSIIAFLTFLLTITAFGDSILPNVFSHINLSEEQKCFINALNHTQHCSNDKLLYVTTMGGGSGLGSEFNAFLIPSLLTAIAYNMRMVYVRSGRKWEYDCPTSSGWACYLAFHCEESGISLGEVNNVHHYLTHDDTSFKIGNMSSIVMHNPGNRMLYETIEKLASPGSECNVLNKLSLTIITSIAARFLYQLNPASKASTHQLNFNRYKLLQQGQHYLSLQLRMTDKKHEMSKEAWAWMGDLSRTAAFIQPYFHSAKTNKLFIGKFP